jgi:hypothetical protein
MLATIFIPPPEGEGGAAKQRRVGCAPQTPMLAARAPTHPSSAARGRDDDVFFNTRSEPCAS